MWSQHLRDVAVNCSIARDRELQKLCHQCVRIFACAHTSHDYCLCFVLCNGSSWSDFIRKMMMTTASRQCSSKCNPRKIRSTRRRPTFNSSRRQTTNDCLLDLSFAGLSITWSTNLQINALHIFTVSQKKGPSSSSPITKPNYEFFYKLWPRTTI